MEPIIFIDPGHSDRDPGAVGYETEFQLAEAVAKHKKAFLEAHYVCKPYVCPSNIDSLKEICKLANDMGAALFTSIHFNAGGGDGFECFVHNEKRRSLGQLFEAQVKAIGQNSRGVKIQPNFVVLRDTNMPAVLLEGAFVDNKKDIEDWNEEQELKAMGIAYAKATAEFLNLEEKVKTVTVILDVLENGSQGKQVKALQKLLGVSNDGIFGKQTEAALKKFQSENGLTADGSAGPETWQKLLGV